MWDRSLELLSVIWSYKISFVPVLVTYFLFDLPAIIRKMTRVAYVPIYFLMFPSGHSDKLYAEYFNEDDFYGVGREMTKQEKERLRRKIQITAVFSMVFATVIAPWLCGLISALYLRSEQFIEFVVFLIVIKTILIVQALYNLRQESRAVWQEHAFVYVVAIYVFYLILVLRGLTKSFWWTQANLNSQGGWGLLVALADYAYVDVFINIVVVSAVAWAITGKFADPANIPPRDSDFENEEQSSATATLSASKS